MLRSPGRCAKGSPSRTSTSPTRRQGPMRWIPAALRRCCRGSVSTWRRGSASPSSARTDPASRPWPRSCSVSTRPGAGRVTADGLDYAGIDPGSLTASVSAAFQDYYRFELTLGQSIGLAAPAAREDRPDHDLWPRWLHPDPAAVAEASRRSGAEELAARLPGRLRHPCRARPRRRPGPLRGRVAAGRHRPRLHPQPGAAHPRRAGRGPRRRGRGRALPAVRRAPRGPHRPADQPPPRLGAHGRPHPRAAAGPHRRAGPARRACWLRRGCTPPCGRNRRRGTGRAGHDSSSARPVRGLSSASWDG